MEKVQHRTDKPVKEKWQIISQEISKVIRELYYKTTDLGLDGTISREHSEDMYM